ncbi:MAG: hypothetical protein ACO3ZZ_08340 [Solirubrobacterales bacterium]
MRGQRERDGTGTRGMESPGGPDEPTERDSMTVPTSDVFMLTARADVEVVARPLDGGDFDHGEWKVEMPTLEVSARARGLLNAVETLAREAVAAASAVVGGTEPDRHRKVASALRVLALDRMGLLRGVLRESESVKEPFLHNVWKDTDLSRFTGIPHEQDPDRLD